MTMYQDLSFKQLITKADKLAQNQHDFLVSSNDLNVITNVGNTYMEVEGKHYKMTEYATRQLATLISMPYPYMQRLREDHSDLLDRSVNELLGDVNKQRLVRTNASNCTALLSNMYKKIDYDKILHTILPIIEENKSIQVVSSSITPTHMYVKFISRQCKLEVSKGDIVAFGGCLSSSNCGQGKLMLTNYFVRCICDNGCVLPFNNGTTVRRIHKGKIITSIDDYDTLYDPDGTDLYEYLREQFALALNPNNFSPVIRMLKESMTISIPEPMETINKIATMYNLDDAEKAQVLMAFLADKQGTLYSLFNAFTHMSKNAPNYSRATELEKQAYEMLTMGVRSLGENKTDTLLLAA